MLESLQYFVAGALYRAGNFILGFVRRALYRRPYNPSSVLIFRSGHLGDSFCALPAVSAVRDRFPDARFILLTAETAGAGAGEILGRFVHFDRVIGYEPGKKGLRSFGLLRRAIGRERPELLIYLPHYFCSWPRQFRDLLFFRQAGCRSAVGFKWEKHLLFSSAQRRRRRFEPEGARLLKLLQPLGVSGPGSAWTGLSQPGDRPVHQPPEIAIHPGAKFPVNRWPAECWRDLSRLLRERLSARVTIVGDEQTADVDLGLPPESGDVRDLRGKTDFGGLAATLRGCDLLVTSDSGPAHVAAAVGTPVAGIYSARDYPGCWYPLGKGNVIIRREPPCQVCHRVECPDGQCLSGISPEEVFKASETILSRKRPKTIEA